jgi:membrane associated rhomboid family serine protease
VAEPRYCYRHPDRETGLSCSECGRPICVDCMSVAPVGIRCPEHAGKQARVATSKPVRTVRRTAARRGVVIRGGDALVTRILVAANVIVYLIGVAQGAGINAPGGSLYAKLWLDGPDVHNGGWWRLITAAFLHANVLHIVFNMLALWWLGAPVEMALGRLRFTLLYFASGLAGSAGALLLSPNNVTVGASGAIFGMLGAGLILEYFATGSLAGNYLTLIVINLVISFAVPGISIGGHLGGLAGGILGTLALARFGQRHPGYGRIGVTGVVSLVAIGVLSVAIAYWKVRGMA